MKSITPAMDMQLLCPFRSRSYLTSFLKARSEPEISDVLETPLSLFNNVFESSKAELHADVALQIRVNFVDSLEKLIVVSRYRVRDFVLRLCAPY